MSGLNAWVDGAWRPVDLRGPRGDVGAIGPAGSFSWPGSNRQDYNNSRAGLGDGLYEPGALSALGGGTTPCTRVLASNTSRIEVITPGLLMISLLCNCSAGMTGTNAWINIRDAVLDKILAAGYMELTDSQENITSVSTVAAGDQIKFLYQKNSGGAATVGFTIRTALIT
ncbi:MAG TPA: hypothetical protein VIT65_05075 [Microlunatus sp.]